MYLYLLYTQYVNVACNTVTSMAISCIQGTNSLLFALYIDQDGGYEFNTAQGKRILRGGVLLWTDDTLGSNLLGGFQEGVGGALRLCRHCMGTKEETTTKVSCQC